MKVILALFLLSINVFAEDTVFEERVLNCGNGQCLPTNFEPQLSLEQQIKQRSVVDVGNNLSNFIVNQEDDETSRDLMLIINNRNDGINFTANMSSTKEDENAPGLILLGSVFNRISINLNGYIGKNGQNASESCAINIQDKKYGETIYNDFINRRFTEEGDPTGVPLGKCVEEDIAFLRTQFICEQFATSEDFLINNGVVDVQFITKKKQCRASTEFSRCTPADGNTANNFETNYYESCQESSGDSTTIEVVNGTLISYVDPKADCNTAVSPDDKDPDGRLAAHWVSTDSIVQLDTFGLTTESCPAEDCRYVTQLEDKTASFDILIPLKGENGTSQGQGLIFIYDSKEEIFTFLPGTPGLGGNNDLQIEPTQKYCAKVRDASNTAISSQEAKEPKVIYEIFNWEVFSIDAGKPDGIEGQNNNNKINIYKKIDSSVRNLLKDLLI